MAVSVLDGARQGVLTTSVIEVRLLGAVEVYRGGVALPIAGRRARSLVCLLALDAGRTVSVERLTRGIWDDNPPERVRGSLQTIVSRLRRVLGEGVLTTDPIGYALQIPRERVDVLRFRDAAAQARAGSTPQEECAHLADALAAWGGEPFGEPLSGWVESHERPGLVEEHLQVLERSIDFDLEAGKYPGCAARLASLVDEHPFRETLWLQLLRALHGAGRTAEALDRYESARDLLATELGTDPNPALQQMHHTLLTASEPLAVPPPAEATPSAVPRQLPVPGRCFTGRAEELQRLDRILPENGEGRVVAVHGPGGVGKTSLVTHWAGSVADAFPDGQLFIDLRGFGPGEQMPSVVAADLMLRGLGLDGSEVPGDPEARSALLRSVLADRRCLVVLDNARDAAQVRPLLPGGPSLVLVTSRSQLRSLVAREGADRVQVGQMSHEESTTMLRAALGAGPATDDEVLGELADLCGHLPVAIGVVAERASRGPTWSLDEVAERLRTGAVARLDELTTGDDDLSDVRTVFDWSYRLLDADSAWLFRLLGLYPDGVICRYAAVALSGLPWREGRVLLDRLADHHLLEIRADGWCVVHDLVLAFARDVLDTEGDPAERAAAWDRLTSWYVHTAYRAATATAGVVCRRLTPGPVAPGVTPQEFETATEAATWFADHRASLRTMLAEMEVAGDHATVHLLASSISTWLELICADAEDRRMVQRAVEAARAAGGTFAEAVSLNRLGTRHLRDAEHTREPGGVGEPGHVREADMAEALACFQRARKLFVDTDDRIGEARVMGNIARLHEMHGEYDDAIAMLEEVLERCRDLDLARHVGFSLVQLADTCRAAGDPERARKLAIDAVGCLEDTGMQQDVAFARHAWAEAEAALGRHDEAEERYREALAIHRSLGDVNKAVTALRKLGEMHRDAGHPEGAGAAWAQAAELLVDADAVHGAARRHRLEELTASLPASSRTG